MTDTDAVPQSLRTWFVIHFWADMVFAIPLFFAPEWFLGIFDFETVEPLTARLVGAALFGIGGVSLATHNASRDSFRTMLILKIIWSGGAVVALVWSLLTDGPPIVWLLLLVFLGFAVVWNYYFFGRGFRDPLTPEME